MERNEEDLNHLSREVRRLLDQDTKHLETIANLELKLQEQKDMVAKVQQAAEHKKEQQVEVIREEMRQMAQKFKTYNEIVAEEIKINEMLR